MEKELHFAIEAVTKACRLTRSIQQSIAALVLEKEDKSPVTAADYASQLLITHALCEAFPGDPWVGEENIHELVQSGGPVLDAAVVRVRELDPDFDLRRVLAGSSPTAGTSRRYWTLDPVDGTKGFLRGGQYVVALALIENFTPVLGVIGCPNLNEQAEQELGGPGVAAYAVRGQGAWLRRMDGQGAPRRITASACADPAQARFVSSFESGHTNNDELSQLQAALGNGLPVDRYDSQVKHVMVAAGKYEVFVRFPPAKNAAYREKLWDHAAACVVVEEAGGIVSDIFGRPLDFSTGASFQNNRGILVTNGRLHPAVTAHL